MSRFVDWIQQNLCKKKALGDGLTWLDQSSPYSIQIEGPIIIETMRDIV